MLSRIAICLALALPVALPSSARACSCAAPATAQEALEQASAAFSGKVTQLRKPFLDRLGLTDTGAHEVTFHVIRAWKGVAGSEVVVRTRLTGEACGYPFIRGVDYLVFVRKTPPGIETGICTGTRDLADADEEVRSLNAVTK